MFGTVLFYGVMLLALVGMCVYLVKQHQLLKLMVGNIITFVNSYGLSQVYDIDNRGYFKPFTETSLIILISVGIILLQVLIVLICKRKNYNVNILGKN